MGGPLIVVPVSALSMWRGATTTGVLAGDGSIPDDYDHACAVEDLAGVIAVGDSGAHALVLADEADRGCFLPEHRAFLRWLVACSEDELMAEAEEVLANPATEWEECGVWVTNGPAVLMDSAECGAELNTEYPDGRLPEQAPVALPAGRWQVRAVQAQTGEDLVGLVQLLPAAD
jgi:hypothetical protein